MPTLPSGSRGWPIIKYPVFSTIVQTPAAMQGETRISKAPFCVWEFQMTFPLLKGTFNDQTSYLAKVAGFFMQMKGQGASWLYDDTVTPDNTIPSSAPVPFGLGDGATKVFQLTRPIGNYQDIIQNLNGAPSIYIAGVLQTSGYSVDAKGVVTFTAAPALNAVLSWSGKYYFRCRFTTDKLDQLSHVFTSQWKLAQVNWTSLII